MPIRGPFVELHSRSAFSFLRGASLPEDLVRRAATLGQPAIAICDHMGFAGSARAHQTAKDHGIRAIVGTTIEIPNSKFHLSAEALAKAETPTPTHLPVLCATHTATRLSANC